jgi:hypothetical protein
MAKIWPVGPLWSTRRDRARNVHAVSTAVEAAVEAVADTVAAVDGDLGIVTDRTVSR